MICLVSFQAKRQSCPILYILFLNKEKKSPFPTKKGGGALKGRELCNQMPVPPATCGYLNLNQLLINKTLNFVPPSHQPPFKGSKATRDQQVPHRGYFPSQHKVLLGTTDLEHLLKFKCAPKSSGQLVITRVAGSPLKVIDFSQSRMGFQNVRF